MLAMRHLFLTLMGRDDAGDEGTMSYRARAAHTNNTLFVRAGQEVDNMLRLQRKRADEHTDPVRPRRTASASYSMHAEPLELPDHPPIEVRHPDAPNIVVRLGPTLTQVMGFGPSGEVATWLANAIVTPSYIVSSEAFDDARKVFDAQGSGESGKLELELDRLEVSALAIERRLEELDRADSAPADEHDVSRSAAALALALEWDALRARSRSAATHSAADAPRVVAPPAARLTTDTDSTDLVLSAHLEVERLRTALGDAKRGDRKALLKSLQTAEQAEREELRAAGVGTYTEYLMSLQAQNGSVGSLRSTFAAVAASAEIEAPSVAEPTASSLHDTEIELRARTAQLLGRLPGSDPASELRGSVTAARPTTQAIDAGERERLIAELAEIDQHGQRIADLLALPDEPRIPSDHELIDIAFPAGATNLVVDGDLLYAVTSDTRDLILERLRDSIFERRVVLVSDDTLLDAWVDTIPQGMLWSSGHLHLVTSGEIEWDDDPDARGAAIISQNRPTDPLAVCTNHPGAATRLACPRCGLAYCSVCLISVDRRGATVECVGCALSRSGVRNARRWRS